MWSFRLKCEYTVVNICLILPGLWKVSNSKNDLLCHSRALAMVLFDKLHVIFAISLQLQQQWQWLISQTLKRWHDPFRCNLPCMHAQHQSDHEIECLASQIPKTWWGTIFSERELAFTIAICYQPSVCCLVCCLSVCLWLFWCQKSLVGDAPFPLKFAFKVTHPL